MAGNNSVSNCVNNMCRCVWVGITNGIEDIVRHKAGKHRTRNLREAAELLKQANEASMNGEKGKAAELEALAKTMKANAVKDEGKANAKLKADADAALEAAEIAAIEAEKAADVAEEKSKDDGEIEKLKKIAEENEAERLRI